MAQGVTLITAHSQDGATPDWTGLAQSGTTLVVYMGVAKLHDMSSQLLVAGMAPDTPVAMIERASLADQRECRSTLSGMTSDAAPFSCAAPPCWSSATLRHATCLTGLIPPGRKPPNR